MNAYKCLPDFLDILFIHVYSIRYTLCRWDGVSHDWQLARVELVSTANQEFQEHSQVGQVEVSSLGTAAA